MTLANTPDLMQIATVLEREWSLLGVRVTLNPMATDALMKMAHASEEQVTLVDLLLAPDQDLFPFWWSGESVANGLNFSNISDRAIDDALQMTHDATTTEALLAAREQVTKAILNDTPAVFLLRPNHHYLQTSNLRGVSDEMQLAIPSDRFSTESQWYVKKGLRWK